MSLSAAINDGPFILLDDRLAGQQRRYENPVEVITVFDPSELSAAAQRLQDYHAKGYYIAGYLAYELGYALEDKLKRLMPDDLGAPLLQFGVFRRVDISKPAAAQSAPDTAQGDAPLDLPLTPAWSESEYLARFKQVKKYIKAGDVYQINLCFPMTGPYSGSPLSLYAGLAARQPVHYGAVISLGQNEAQNTPDIISLSPELFFERRANDMTMRPMKGTMARTSNAAEDKRLRSQLKQDIKSQAENLMIVDLLRNDLSRISQTGTVKVPELFALETYPTLHQMTSVVTSTLKDGVDFKTLFKAIFPCGSITGAPKIRAMEIIRELEAAPRGAYCGAIGYIDPDETACFNVAIRTLILEGGRLRYNVGSGVVLDSIGADEYKECLLKARLLAAPHAVAASQGAPAYLIETMRLKPDGFIPRLDLHLTRLARSARALNYPYYRGKVLAALRDIALPQGPAKLRVTLARSGEISAEVSALTPLPAPLKLAISKNSLTAQVQETRHKISEREFYDGERVRIHELCGADEVLFLNSEGQLCEGSFTSLFLKTADGFVTPDIRCGLLPGVLRAQMIKDGEARPEVLTLEALKNSEIFMGNSLRGLMPAHLISLRRV